MPCKNGSWTVWHKGVVVFLFVCLLLKIEVSRQSFIPYKFCIFFINNTQQVTFFIENQKSFTHNNTSCKPSKPQASLKWLAVQHKHTDPLRTIPCPFLFKRVGEKCCGGCPCPTFLLPCPTSASAATQPWAGQQVHSLPTLFTKPTEGKAALQRQGELPEMGFPAL